MLRFANVLTACLLTEWDFVGNSTPLKANIFMNLNSDHHPTKILHIITTDKLRERKKKSLLSPI